MWCIMGAVTANAQKFALIDMEYIMENIPAYQQATNQLNQLSQRYQKEVEAKAKEAENLYKTYQKNAASLNASQKNQQEEAIIAKEKEAMELRQKYFGAEGEMSKQQEALLSSKTGYTKQSSRFQSNGDTMLCSTALRHPASFLPPPR